MADDRVVEQHIVDRLSAADVVDDEEVAFVVGLRP